MVSLKTLLCGITYCLTGNKFRKLENHQVGNEMCPTVNIEALTYGPPVITYKTGGYLAAIDEKSGVVVEQGNVMAIFDAIRRMKEHPLSSEDCRKRAEEHFDKDKCFEEYINLYEKLIQ